jgi:hypothetical protein
MSMPENLTPPPQIPELGFYYHYKHDPTKGIEYMAYEFLGVGHHTERDPEEWELVYRPLYQEAPVYRAGKFWDVRPLHMIFEPATKDGQSVPRFRKITEPSIIAHLTEIRKQMYGS